jgi:hypothetical protein
VIALSGEPQKEESRQRLKRLRNEGATITSADQTDILSQLRRQSALAGKNGILILSIATHGFVRDGIPYILGASSLAQVPQTTLSVANILDTIARARASRSLVFVDACRERLTPPTRSITSGQTETAAPLLRRMSHTHGQAIFFGAAAGQYAYDDPVRRNGVFTAAVIDGLKCRAAKPEGIVTACTLGTYVENSVRRWINNHRDTAVASAIQLSIDGEARNMPLSQCWVQCHDPAACRVSRVSLEGSKFAAFRSDGTEAWRRDAGEDIQTAVVEDIDADGINEVVLATKKGIRAFNADGNPLWSATETMPLQATAVGDLFRDHMREVVTLWKNRDSSRIAVYSAEGERLSLFDYPGRLDHVAIGRPTNHHAPKIVVTGKSGEATVVLLFAPKNVSRGKPLWSGQITPRNETVQRIEFKDYEGCGKGDIFLTTSDGSQLILDFKGRVVAHTSLRFHLLHSRRTRP